MQKYAKIIAISVDNRPHKSDNVIFGDTVLWDT